MQLPATARLRDGAEVRLRRSVLADADALWRMDGAIVRAGQGVVQIPEEIPVTSEPARDRLRWFVENPESLHLVAEEGGRLVGAVDVRRLPFAQLDHNGTLTLGVHPDRQGVGLGRALIEAALVWADGAEVLRVELWVLAANARARALYASCGFVEAWRRPRFLRRPDGAWEDDLLMVRDRTATQPGPAPRTD